MKVYVASAFEDYERTRAAHKALRAAGIEITHDWTQEVDRYPTGHAPVGVGALHAQEDVDGVHRADAVLVLTNGDRTRGCGMWIEMGHAQALRKLIVLTGGQRDRSFFALLNNVVKFEDDAAGVECLIRIATSHRDAVAAARDTEVPQ